MSFSCSDTRAAGHGEQLATRSELGLGANFRSILDEDGTDHPRPVEPACFRDLNLDQIVAAVTADRDEYDLSPFFHRPLTKVEAILYRQEVARDLGREPMLDCLTAFADGMRAMRAAAALSDKLRYQQQQQRWFLRAAELYSGAVRTLAERLTGCEIASRGLTALRGYLADHVASERFVSLATAVGEITGELARIRYAVVAQTDSFQVRRYDDEQDYSAEVTRFFEKFSQGAAEDHRVKFGERREMDHIEGKVLEFVALLHPDVFGRLSSFCAERRDFLDPTIARFDRELQFYLTYRDFVGRLTGEGLRFCFPCVTDTGKDVRSEAGFDLALASKLRGTGTRIVCNDFHLAGQERILLVSGPNQGGKTTFARVFGQMHYLASLGCPVPGTSARTYLFDEIHTHFEREETIANLRGKLQDDLVRIHDILERATPRSIIIMNEIFNSTALVDAMFLARRVIERVVDKDILCVCVSFLDELTSVSDTIVSMTSTVVPDDPATRSYKVVRRAADGRSYAMSIAEKYRLTYDDVLRRVAATERDVS